LYDKTDKNILLVIKLLKLNGIFPLKEIKIDDKKSTNDKKYSINKILKTLKEINLIDGIYLNSASLIFYNINLIRTYETNCIKIFTVQETLTYI